MICSGLDAPRMTVDVLGFFATHAKASAATVVSSSDKHGDADINQTFEKTIYCLSTLLSQGCQLLNFADLFLAFGGFKVFDSRLEEGFMGSEATLFRDSFVILAGKGEE